MGLVAGIGTAVAAVAAEVGVAVTATALTVGFETIAAVGAVLGVVGQVTHNKALGFAGLALGAVGGIGALASSAGLLGSGAGLFSDAPTTAAAADAASAGTVDSVAGVADSAAGLPPEITGGGIAADAIGDGSGLPGGIGAASETGGVGLSDIAGAVKPAAGFIQSADSNAPDGTGHAIGGAGGELPVPPIPPPGGPPQAQPGPTPGVGGNGPSTAATNPSIYVQDAQGNLTLPGSGTPAGGGIGGVFSSLAKFADAHPAVAFGALQAGGSLLTGAFSTLTPAQVALATAQAANNDAAAAQQKLQTANLAQPKAVASSVPVSGQAQLVPTPATPPPPVAVPGGPAGFINQNPVPSQQITGVAA